MTTVSQPQKRSLPKLKKTGHSTLKLVHLFFNAFWIGGGLGMILLLTIGLQLGDVRAITTAVQILDLGIVVPSAFGSLLTAILFSSLTHWGFVKHRWIIAKYVINLFPVLAGPVLQAPWLIRMDEISRTLAPGAGLPGEYLDLRNLFLAFTVIQWSFLLVAVYLSVFKPTLRARASLGQSKSGHAAEI